MTKNVRFELYAALAGLVVAVVVGCTAGLLAASNHYRVGSDRSLALKCMEESTSKTRASFVVTPEGIDTSSAICWPDGIDGE